MRNWWVVLTVGLFATGLFAPIPDWSSVQAPSASAWHSEYVDPWIWSKYMYGTPPDVREIRWQPCAMTGPQKNLASGGMWQWPLWFARSTEVTKVTDGCTANYDLVIAAADLETTLEECQTATACIGLAAWNMNADGRVVVFKAVEWFNSELWGSLSDVQRKHIFAHEFGHAMSLQHHGNCGESVMSGYPCSDLVHHGSFPNDICSPAQYLYYPDWLTSC